MRILPTAIVVLLLCGCSAEWHLRTAMAKDPTILTEGREVVTVVDTLKVVRDEIRVDTVMRWSVDTVTTYVDRVRIRTKVDTIERTVFVDVTCPPDTVKVPYERTKVIVRPSVDRGLPIWVYAVCAVAVLLILALLRRS